MTSPNISTERSQLDGNGKLVLHQSPDNTAHHHNAHHHHHHPDNNQAQTTMTTGQGRPKPTLVRSTDSKRFHYQLFSVRIWFKYHKMNQECQPRKYICFQQKYSPTFCCHVDTNPTLIVQNTQCLQILMSQNVKIAKIAPGKPLSLCWPSLAAATKSSAIWSRSSTVKDSERSFVFQDSDQEPGGWRIPVW